VLLPLPLAPQIPMISMPFDLFTSFLQTIPDARANVNPPQGTPRCETFYGVACASLSRVRNFFIT
jgi:hypothetical protein